MSKRTILWAAIAVVATGVALGAIYMRKVFEEIEGLGNIGSSEDSNFVDEF